MCEKAAKVKYSDTRVVLYATRFRVLFFALLRKINEYKKNLFSFVFAFEICVTVTVFTALFSDVDFALFAFG